MTKSFVLCAAALALSYLGVSHTSAQSPPAVIGPRSAEPLPMVVDAGLDQPILYESHEGIPEAAVLVVGQPVEITLRFPGNSAGGAVTVCPLDGGQIDVQGPVTISPDGSLVFHYQSGALPGLYRILIAGAQQRQISFYAVDPNRPRVARPGGE